ncbi:MAG: hypothetical protein GY777_24350 [Candidatus Brocadiaceae bacterium]|nr:hypothetical protein [Candidatus Brocadiaceae bacterium]
MGKDNYSCQNKLGQILVEYVRVEDSDIQNALRLQKENSEHELLGVILLKMNLITKEELSTALHKQIKLSVNEKKSDDNLIYNEEIKEIVDKYKEAEFLNDLKELMGITTLNLRNSMGAISTALLEFREREEKDDVNKKFFKMILYEIDRLERIVTGLYKPFVLNGQIDSPVNEKESGINVSSNEEIKKIANKYMETEYFDVLHELMGITTHKVRNPLAGITAAFGVISERAKKNDTNERFFEMCFSEIDRLENIVRDLYRTFSRR